MISAKKKIWGVSIAIIASALIFSAFIVVRAANSSDIQFPIAELGNCKDQKACKSYCDNLEHAQACAAFAQSHGLASQEEVEHAAQFSKFEKGPGGCTSPSSCETYCSDLKHIDECVTFAEQNGLMQGKELEEAKMVQQAIKQGATPPGGCTNKKQCEQYCTKASNVEECITFGQKAGFIKPEEVDEIRRVMPLIQKGESPGGCTTKETCEAYCEDESHAQECANFAEKAGFMKPEEAERFRKTGGKGPGGCHGREACDAFCKDPVNQKTCFEFARDNGFIEQEDLNRMKEGAQQLQQMMANAPAELKACFEEQLGPGTADQMASGEFFGGSDTREKMQMCFEKFPPKFDGQRNQEGERNSQMQRESNDREGDQQERGRQEGQIPVQPGAQMQLPGSGPRCSSEEECRKLLPLLPEHGALPFNPTNGNFIPPSGNQMMPPTDRIPEGSLILPEYPGLPIRSEEMVPQQQVVPSPEMTPPPPTNESAPSSSATWNLLWATLIDVLGLPNH